VIGNRYKNKPTHAASIVMVSLIEYKDYLKQQYERIEKRVLADESITVLKQLENKEHLFRRIAEIFEKTFNQ
jgi:hypothetical protein